VRKSAYPWAPEYLISPPLSMATGLLSMARRTMHLQFSLVSQLLLVFLKTWLDLPFSLRCGSEKESRISLGRFGQECAVDKGEHCRVALTCPIPQ